MIYTVSKERGSSRWYVHPVGDPKAAVPGSAGDKKRALHIAADYEGVSYKEYMALRRKKGRET